MARLVFLDARAGQRFMHRKPALFLWLGDCLARWAGLEAVLVAYATLATEALATGLGGYAVRFWPATTILHIALGQ